MGRQTSGHVNSAELFRTLDEVIATGEAVEVRRPGGTVRLVPSTGDSRLTRPRPHADRVVGNAARRRVAGRRLVGISMLFRLHRQLGRHQPIEADALFGGFGRQCPVQRRRHPDEQATAEVPFR